jgi:Zn-dependent M28 family amino/carboxypeptidase
LKKLIRPAFKAFLAAAALILAAVLAAALFVSQASFRKTPYSPAFRSDPGILKGHVDYLCTKIPPRNTDNMEGLNKAADYIGKTFSMYTKKTGIQEYQASERPCKNIIANFGPGSGELLVIGAHYDVYGDFKGADDNASGVAGLLELSRLFSLKPPRIPVALVAFSTEEPPYFGGSDMGSVVHAASLKEKNVVLKGMICMTMIGYYTEKQSLYYMFQRLLYPAKGNFVVIVGRWKDRHLATEVKAGIKGAGGVTPFSYNGPMVIGCDLSSHRSYWKNGYNAVLVTDTAFYRNPNYHTQRDTPETLDYLRMAAVVDGVFNTAVSYKD